MVVEAGGLCVCVVGGQSGMSGKDENFPACPQVSIGWTLCRIKDLNQISLKGRGIFYIYRGTLRNFGNKEKGEKLIKEETGRGWQVGGWEIRGAFSLLILTFLAWVRTMGGAVGGVRMAAGGRLAGKGVKVCWWVCWCWCMCWCWWNSALRSETGASGEAGGPRPRSELWTRKRLFNSCLRRSCSVRKESGGERGKETRGQG